MLLVIFGALIVGGPTLSVLKSGLIRIEGNVFQLINKSYMKLTYHRLNCCSDITV